MLFVILKILLCWIRSNIILKTLNKQVYVYKMKITLEQILITGIHIGNSVSSWNPKISRYIYGVQKGFYVLDLVKTYKQLVDAQIFITGVRREGKRILFVGTNVQVRIAVEERARASQSFFVRKRWLGGMLTNWTTIRSLLLQLHRLEREQRLGIWSVKRKKDVAQRQVRLNHLKCYLEGIKGIQSFPGAVIILDQKSDIVAVRECRKLGIPTICRLDTDCDPSLVDIGIPINDDSAERSRLFLELLLPRIQLGRRWWLSKKVQKQKKSDSGRIVKRTRRF
jgi:small subunit ribosomal protein S2